MPAAGHSFVAHVTELLGIAGAITSRRMFGGHGIYLDGLFVGIIADDVLYLKADAQTENGFRAAGSVPFRYTRQDRVMTLQFWSAPEDAMESPRLMQPWARQAFAAALRAGAAGNSTKKTGRARRPSIRQKSR